MSLALALSSRTVMAGSWLAVVGVPMLGLEAAAELGVPLSRLVMIGVDSGPKVWAERVAAAADGFDIVLTSPPAGAERVVRMVRNRLQARGVVMLAVGRTSPGVSCDIEFSTTSSMWIGVGDGSGHLIGRKVTVRVGGRRIPMPVERDLWLPGPTGRVEIVEQPESSRSELVQPEVIEQELSEAV
jgi:hypothetical protein